MSLLPKEANLTDDVIVPSVLWLLVVPELM